MTRISRRIKYDTQRTLIASETLMQLQLLLCQQLLTKHYLNEKLRLHPPSERLNVLVFHQMLAMVGVIYMHMQKDYISHSNRRSPAETLTEEQ